MLPIKAVFMNLLSVTATYGVLVLFFQDGWGQTLLGPSCLAGKRADPDRAPRRKLCLHPYLNVRIYCASPPVSR